MAVNSYQEWLDDAFAHSVDYPQEEKLRTVAINDERIMRLLQTYPEELYDMTQEQIDNLLGNGDPFTGFLYGV